MSKQELREQTVGDPKFWLGIAAFVLSSVTVIVTISVTYGRLAEKVDRIGDAIPELVDRVQKLERRVDVLDSKQHSKLGDNRELWKYEKD